MKLEEASLALESRSVGACIDIAILFYRHHIGKLLPLSFIFGAVPVTFGMLGAANGNGWILSGLLFLFVSPFLGATVVAGAGHHVFGEEFTIRRALLHTYRRLPVLLLWLPAARFVYALIGVMCWGLLSIPAATRYGFLSEVLILEQLRGSRTLKRLEEILRNSYLETCGRYASILAFTFCVGVMLFLLFDLGTQFLFATPILMAKVSWAVAAEDIANLLAYDPLLVGALSATWWLVYPLARLAWFFCYLDARVRKEGWDVEIELRVEARRLSHAEAGRLSHA